MGSAATSFFAQIVSVVSMAVGALTLVRWAFNIAVLKRIVPGLESMKLNTTICLILIASRTLALSKAVCPVVAQATR